MRTIKVYSTQLFCSAIIRRVLVCALTAAFLVSCLTGPSLCRAELIDRVIAYVDDRAITYSEFEERYKKIRQAVPDITEEEALNSMVNALLLLQRAKKMRLEAPNEDDLIKEYLDITIKSRIVLKEEKMLEYYNNNRHSFGDREFSAVRPEIEKYMLELETNMQLKEHLKELRRQSNIVIQLKDK
jgi:isopentenyl diphosphate isomerase/L-lactate dehydrogenase-like FMN-dependent dehydrogenase